MLSQFAQLRSRQKMAQQGLGLDPPTKVLIQALNGVRRPQRLPLRLGEVEKGEQLFAALGQAPRDPRTALAPLALGVRSLGTLATGGVDDMMKVIAELSERMLGRFALEIALPSMMRSNSGWRPGPVGASTKPAQALADSAPHTSSARSCFSQSASTPTAVRTGTLTALPALRTRRARASKSAVSRIVVTLREGLAAWMTRALGDLDLVYLYLESGAALSSGVSAPRIRQVLPPAR